MAKQLLLFISGAAMLAACDTQKLDDTLESIEGRVKNIENLEFDGFDPDNFDEDDFDEQDLERFGGIDNIEKVVDANKNVDRLRGLQNNGVETAAAASGQANYTGDIIVFESVDNHAAVGDLAMTADFDSGSLKGTGENFASATHDNFQPGTLIIPNDSANDGMVTVTGTISAGAVNGVVEGDVTLNNASQSVNTAYEGKFGQPTGTNNQGSVFIGDAAAGSDGSLGVKMIADHE